MQNRSGAKYSALWGRGARWRAAACALAASGALRGGVARAAEPAAAGGAGAALPPRLLSSPEIASPPGAEGAASVVLEVVVRADGTAGEARAVEGAEPFVAAALAAARGFRFEPASRAGAPVAARVRLAVSFRPPPEAAAGEAAPAPQVSTGAAGAGAPARGGPRAEVRVRGQRAAPAVTSLSRAEVRQLPGAFGDPFRAIEAMPGVTPIFSGLPYFYVRGAPPGNVGYFLDGVRVPYLYHVALGPSVVHPGLIERVDLYPGGYPARFGRFAGGVVAGETAPPRPEWHGEGNVRVFDAGALVEAPFAGGRGTALVGGRYSYAAAAISLLSPDTTLDYRDYQVRVSYALGPRDRVSLFSFGAYDLVGEREGDEVDVAFGAEFYRLDLRHDHAFEPGGGGMRTALTLGFDQSRLPDERNARDHVLGARVELERPLGGGVELRAGVDAMVDDYEVDLVGYADPFDARNSELRELIPTRTDVAFGARADLVWRPWPGAQVVPGLRADVFRSGGEGAVAADPRLAASLPLGRGLRAVHAFGLAHQVPSFVVPVPGLGIGRLSGGLQRSLQASSGLEVDLGGGTSASGTVFKNAFFAMSDAAGTTRANDDEGAAFGARALGSAYGLELFLRRRLTGRLGGFVTYTLSRTTRSLGRETFPATFDRTHVLNAALAYGLGRGWRAGTRVVVYTGIPRATSDPDDERPGAPAAPPGPRARGREPPFFRLDLRLEKRWDVGRAGWVSLVIEALNATLNREFVGGERLGPISVPSVGVEGGL
ncbi:MAG TPA: TonB-dependent receptor plug domain-containing protein [Polyangiaceae bacterium]|nr:TonB-dependent receptor plug domain-containing protein [Polyangiaceae bacterium]